MAGAFEELRILDFTRGVAGPLACMLLADLGAEVIKIESPAEQRDGTEPGYLCWNRNKRRVELDLETVAGLRSARELLESADVAVFDDPPEELEAETVRAQCPRLLYTRLPAYDRAGRAAHLPRDHGLLSALSGTAYQQSSWEDVPIYLVTPQLHYAHGLTAAAAIAAGVYERGRTGLGQELSVSGLDAVAATSSASLLRGPEALQQQRRSGTRGGIPNYRLYRCADGQWLFLGTLLFEHFVKALEALELLDILVMDGMEGELANVMKPEMSGAVSERLEARFAEEDRAKWLRILREHGVPHAPVGDRTDWFASETVAANEMRVTLPHPDLGRVDVPGVPIKLSETPGRVKHLMETARPESLERRTPRKPGSAPARSGGPLAGVVVLDLGVIIAGAFASSVLANFGADVIKVESPSGDPFRPYGLGFVGFNQGKRGVVLDLKRPEGRDVFYELVRRADVVCDNFRGGVLERLQVDYDSLRKVNPRIVSASITGYGSEGPLAADPGFDPLLQAQSGLMATQGGDDEPVFHTIAVNDVASALVMAFGVVAALHARESTGRGQRVETSLANQSVLTQSAELTWYEGRPPAPLGDRDCVGIAALQRFYACADGWIALACAQELHFGGLCAALEHPDWVERWSAPRALLEPRDGELAERVSDALKQLPRAQLLERLRARGVPAVSASRPDEVFESSLFLADDFFVEMDHPTHGRMTTVRGYADWSRTPAGFARRAPELGEHTEEVLQESGFDRSQIASLIAAGIAQRES